MCKRPTEVDVVSRIGTHFYFFFFFLFLGGMHYLDGECVGRGGWGRLSSVIIFAICVYANQLQ